MAWLYSVLILAAVSYSLVLWSSLPPVDDEVAVEVIFGEGYDVDSTRMPPMFARRGAGHYAPEHTLDAIRAASKKMAHGIEFDLSFTRDDVGVLFYDDILERTTSGQGYLANTSFAELRRQDARTKHPMSRNCSSCAGVLTLEEGVQECLRLGLRFIVHVKRYDDRALALLSVFFFQRPELYRRGLVASPIADFIYDLRCRNPDIVTALTWRPGLLAYEDAEKQRPRYDSLARHVRAVIADWVLEQALNTGLLHQLTGASAVLMCKNALNEDGVRMWRDRGVHVIVWTPNERVEKEYFLQVLRVPIITDKLSLKYQQSTRKNRNAARTSKWPINFSFPALWTRSARDIRQCAA